MKTLKKLLVKMFAKKAVYDCFAPRVIVGEKAKYSSLFYYEWEGEIYQKHPAKQLLDGKPKQNRFVDYVRK